MKIVMSDKQIKQCEDNIQDIESWLRKEDMDREFWLKIKITNPMFASSSLPQMLYDQMEGIEFLGFNLLAINIKEPGGEETKKKIIEYINNL